jgi:hypothetical protein
MDAFEQMDDLGPAKVLYVHEPRVGLKGIVVVDNTAAGPAIGGLRMVPDGGVLGLGAAVGPAPVRRAADALVQRPAARRLHSWISQRRT